MSATQDQEPCVSCTEVASQKCAACGEKLYCSKECQQTDWPAHKFLCKELRNFQDRPKPDMRRVLYLPVLDGKPKFKWLPVISYGGEVQIVDVEGETNGRPHKFESIQTNRITGTRYDGVVSMSYDENGVGTYPRNRAVDAITGKLGTNRLHGPLFVMCGEAWEEDEEDISEVRDFDMRALSVLVAHLITREIWGPIDGTQTKTSGVRALCCGELGPGIEKYQKAEFPFLHPIFKGKAEVPPISKAIGMPLLIMKAPTPKTEATLACNGMAIQEIAMLFRGIDPSAPDDDLWRKGMFGLPPMGRWDTQIGNVQIVRQDKEPFTPTDLSALADFCLLHLTMYFQLVSERKFEVSAARLKEIEDLLVKECTPEKWATYLQDWKKYKQQGIKDDEEVNTRVDGVVSMAFDSQTADRLFAHLSNTHQ